MTRVLGVLLALAATGCIRASEIVMVDRATALEQQASGSFDDLQKESTVGAVGARPVPLTPNQLEALGIMPAPIIDQSEQTEADRVDVLLRQHCLGEGNDGLLVDTHDACIGASDRGMALALLDRSNRARVELWQWMHKQRPDQPQETLRRSWRELHAQGVVCRGWIQDDAGKWGAKVC